MGGLIALFLRFSRKLGVVHVAALSTLLPWIKDTALSKELIILHERYWLFVWFIVCCQDYLSTARLYYLQHISPFLPVHDLFFVHLKYIQILPKITNFLLKKKNCIFIDTFFSFPLSPFIINIYRMNFMYLYIISSSSIRNSRARV